MPLRRAADELERILRRDRRVAAKTRLPIRVVRHDTDGTVLYRPLDGECLGRTAPASVYDGQTLTEIPQPFTSVGTAGIASLSAFRATATPWLESVSPDFYMPGEAYTVVVKGRGFVEEVFALDFLLPDSASERTLNPYITQLEVRWLDSATAEIDIVVDVAAPARALQSVPVSYDNPGMVIM